MKNSLKLFSDFVRDLTDHAQHEDADTLAHWAVQDLSQRIGFDCAWYGWAELGPDKVQIHANSTLELPENYIETWSEISQQDLLAAGIMENPGRASSYDRKGPDQTDGMIALSDAYDLRKMATAMHARPGRMASFYLSGYRNGGHSRPWSEAELEFLQCAVEQLSCAMKQTSYLPDASEGAVSVLVNPQGVAILGLANLRSRFGALWPGWSGDRLPESLCALLDHPGEHILPDEGLIVLCHAASDHNQLALRRLTLRPLTGYDLLTRREQQVAMALAGGKSHKETARLLGVAPATIRNQTQSIYAKLGVDNRANLAAIVHGQPAP